MDRQDELLAREDGRYFAIGKFGTGLATIVKTEKLSGSVVSFGIPSGPALYLHLARKSYLSIKIQEPMSFFDVHPQGIWPDAQGPLFDFFESFMVHVVFAHTAIEAFANEVIPEDFKFTTERKGEKVVLGRDEERRSVGP